MERELTSQSCSDLYFWCGKVGWGLQPPQRAELMILKRKFGSTPVSSLCWFKLHKFDMSHLFWAYLSRAQFGGHFPVSNELNPLCPSKLSEDQMGNKCMIKLSRKILYQKNLYPYRAKVTRLLNSLLPASVFPLESQLYVFNIPGSSFTCL